MPRSSTASDKIYVLKPRPCRVRGVWWALVHALAVAGLAGSGLPAWWRIGLCVAVAAHWRLRARAAAPLVLVTESGRWSVPARGLHGLEADPRSAYTRHWVRLVLGRGAGAATFVLLSPEYAVADWRRIQLALRVPPPAPPGGREPRAS